MAPPVTLRTIVTMVRAGEKIAMVTAYDAPSARLAEAAGADILLVGDSLGMVVLGYPDTLSVTLQDMIHHTRAAARVRERALLVADLPFMSYQISPEQALKSAGRLVQQGGAQAVKLEGGQPVLRSVQRIVDAGIPVMAHLGLTPQSIHQLGGYTVQGKTAVAAARIRDDARRLEEAGAFSLVLECVPSDLAAKIAAELTIPVIGIGAGAEVDGQVLVFHDLLRYGTQYAPKFVRAYADLNALIPEAIGQFVADVKAGSFPSSQEMYAPNTGVLEALSAIADKVEREHPADESAGGNGGAS